MILLTIKTSLSNKLYDLLRHTFIQASHVFLLSFIHPFILMCLFKLNQTDMPW
jgi:hypothetical protein